MNLSFLQSRDSYTTTFSLEQLMSLVKKEKWHLYHVMIDEETIYFEALLSEYFKIAKYKEIHYLKTTGIFGYIRFFLSKKRNWSSLLASILSLWIYSNTIWDISIKGENANLTEQLLNSFNQAGIHQFAMFVSDTELMNLEEKLRQSYFKEIEWLNIERKGDSLKIVYMPRKQAFKEILKYEPLISKKEAIVAYFEVESGRKLVKINDYVKIGDVLVTPDIIDAFGNTKKTYVKGVIFGYTMYTLEAELEWPYQDDISKPFAYYRLLFHLRNEISNELTKNERIESENILHFSQQEGKIKMNIQYTLYEDITKP